MVWVAKASPEVDAQSQWRIILVVCTVLSILSVTIVCMRLWVRFSARGLKADDYMAALSMLFAVAYSVICIVQTKFGLGLPIALRPTADLVPYTRVNFSGRPIYQIGISFFKIALLLSYLNLVQRTNQRTYRTVILMAIATIFLAHLGCALSLIFACSPVRKSWDPATPGTCLASGPSFTGYAIVTIISDVAVSLIPVPLLLGLNITTSKKVGLIGIFLLGLFTTVCSILRYLQINRIQYGDGNSTMLVLWGTVEFNVGNIVSSLPFLTPVFLRKAREYRSKQPSDKYASSEGRGSAKVEGDRHKLSDLSRDGGLFAGSKKQNLKLENSSEENILKEDSPFEHSILKSITYTVQVGDEEFTIGKESGARGT